MPVIDETILTQEEIEISAKLFRLLSTKESGYSIAYCLWYLGFKQFSSYDEEDIKAGVNFYKNGFKDIGLPVSVSDEEIQTKVVAKLEEQMKKANRNIPNQSEWWELFDKLRPLIDTVPPKSPNLLNGNILTRVILTEEGKEFVKKHRPYKIVSKVNNFFNAVTKFLEPQIALEVETDKLVKGVSVIQDALNRLGVPQNNTGSR